MIVYRCFVQENQISDVQRQSLEAQLKSLAQEVFPDDCDAVMIDWNTIAEGFGFTAGKDSTTAVIGSVVPDGTTQENRVRLMKGVGDMWSQETGVSLNEILGSALDLSLAIQVQ